MRRVDAAYQLMPAARWVAQSDRSRALVASLALHILLIGLFVSQRVNAPDELQEPIPVELVIDQTPETAVKPAPPTADQPAPPTPGPNVESPAAPSVPRPAVPSSTIKATELYSAQLLQDPRSRRSRETLAKLAPSARLEQICNLEAMAQIAAHDGGVKPDKVLAYAFEPVRLDGLKLVAAGAAYHAGHNWYRLRFTCSGDDKGAAVKSFEFIVGSAVPRQLWEDHYLTGGFDADPARRRELAVFGPMSIGYRADWHCPHHRNCFK